MRVQFTSQARAQLTAARDYIRSHSSIAARNFRDKVAQRLLQLGSFPGIGHVIPEAPDGPIRQILIGQYRFFYRVAEDTVWIVGVWHGAQLTAVPEQHR